MRPLLSLSACATSLILCCSPVFATYQAPDKLIYGGREYWTPQIPMLGLWHYEEGEPPVGKERPPRFDFVASANNAGYFAVWEIRDSKLFLKEITGRMNGRDVKNEAILANRRFPVVAKWFSGNIYLAVGDQDQWSEEFESVIVFKIREGSVVDIDFHKSVKIEHSWNGLPVTRDKILLVIENAEKTSQLLAHRNGDTTGRSNGC